MSALETASETTTVRGSTPLIVISSRTGNTLMLAHAICDAWPGSVLMKPEDLPEDLSIYNPVLLGFWCDRGMAPEDMQRAAKRFEGKRIGCFATMGGNPEDEKSKDWMRRTSEELVASGRGNTLVETFLCRGRIDPELFARMTTALGVPSAKRAARRRKLIRTGSIYRAAWKSSEASSARTGNETEKRRLKSNSERLLRVLRARLGPRSMEAFVGVKPSNAFFLACDFRAV